MRMMLCVRAGTHEVITPNIRRNLEVISTVLAKLCSRVLQYETGLHTHTERERERELPWIVMYNITGYPGYLGYQLVATFIQYIYICMYVCMYVCM